MMQNDFPKGDSERSPRAVVKAAVEPSRAKPGRRAYRKGEEKREIVLNAAREVFAEEGYGAATTRQIAKRAGASLPTLHYYFGDKAGLYFACIETISQAYEAAMGGALAAANAALQSPMAPETARSHLRKLLDGLGSLLLDVDPGERLWSKFLQRELSRPGEGYEILYARIFARFINVTAELVCRAVGETTITTEHRVRAVLLYSSISLFQYSSQLFERALMEGATHRDQASVIKRLIDDEISRLRPQRRSRTGR